MLSRFDSRIKSAYFAPTLNWLDLPAGFLACAACVLRYLDEGQDPLDEADPETTYETYRYVLALAVLALWMRQLRILLNISLLGPLVMIILRMTVDILKWSMVTSQRPHAHGPQAPACTPCAGRPLPRLRACACCR